MVLTPNDLLRLDEHEYAKFEDLVALIQRRIVEVGPKEFNDAVRVNYIRMISGKVANHIGRLFEEAGWVVASGRSGITIRIKPNDFIGKKFYT